MKIFKHLWETMLSLNDPHLVAAFQKLCQIDISYTDSVFSTARSDLRDLSCSEIIPNDDDPDNQGESSSKNGLLHDHTLKNTKSVHPADCTSEAHPYTNGSITRKRTPKEEGDKSLLKLAPSCSENRLFHHSMENHVSFKINNRFLYYLFSFGSSLGNEIFYCLLFSYAFWNVDGFVCRRIILIWTAVMYIGQATKDIIRWPRPESPPVAKLEKRYELEYGMPSTHAMVAFSIPFSIFFFTVERYIYSWPLMFVLCALWCCLVCLSRIYLGMHSFLDVACGLMFSILLTPILFPVVEAIDRFQITNPYAPIVMIAVPLLLAFCYPTLDKWSTTRSDTVLILGVMSGISVASQVACLHGLYTEPSLSPPYLLKLPDADFVLPMIVRMAFGGAFLFVSRWALRFVLLRLLCGLFGVAHDDPRSRKMLKIELPFQFITYFLLGVHLIYTIPLGFKYIGVSRLINFQYL